MPILSVSRSNGVVTVTATVRNEDEIDQLADALEGELTQASELAQYVSPDMVGATAFGHFRFGDKVRIVKSDRQSNVGREGYVTDRTFGSSENVLTVHKIGGQRTAFSVDDLRQNKLEIVAS